MKKQFSRRDALKLAAAGLASSAVGCASNNNLTQPPSASQSDEILLDSWRNTHDRLWVGGRYWANPMEDWRVENGGVECASAGGNRSIHELTAQITDPQGSISLSVVVSRVQLGNTDGGAGLRLGARSELNEYRSNCFVQKGLDAGIIDSELALGEKRVSLVEPVTSQSIKLELTGTPQNGITKLVLVARDVASGKQLGVLQDIVESKELLGNVAVVSNFALSSEAPVPASGSRYRFSDWRIHGSAFGRYPEQRFGPILWAMYTLSDSRTDEGFVMKLSALTGPMGEQDSHQVELQVMQGGEWQSKGLAALDPDAWVATFRLTNWQASDDTRYRLRYAETRQDGSTEYDVFEGIIKANPDGRPLRMAALTCQNDYAFPYEPVAINVAKLSPDLILFSGDQIYENHGGFGFVRFPEVPAIHCYLRKYYQFGWAFREAMRNSPTVCLPDDHDVFQGNLWGEGGAAMNPEFVQTGRSDAWGGYIEPVRMLEAVNRTHTAHHPDPVDPTPSARGISVYYTDLVYGNVSFAILADRHWKSGPERLDIIVGESGEGEDPTFVNPDYDHPDLELLGQRQEAFLEQWAKDWRGHELKAILSQTVFAGISTHQPRPDRYLKYDFDSSGWPATARNRAIEIMRQSKALHICGDTHLGTLSQYGVHQQRDSNWAFCTPAIAAGWPRWWRPDDVNLPVSGRPSHGLAQTGEYLDSFGNKVYVYAVGNPEVGKAANRYIQAHEKGSGFGFIHFDTKAKTYTTEAYRFLVDATLNNPEDQFPGWPVTIHQDENMGKNRLG